MKLYKYFRGVYAQNDLQSKFPKHCHECPSASCDL